MEAGRKHFRGPQLLPPLPSALGHTDTLRTRSPDPDAELISVNLKKTRLKPSRSLPQLSQRQARPPAPHSGLRQGRQHFDAGSSRRTSSPGPPVPPAPTNGVRQQGQMLAKVTLLRRAGSRGCSLVTQAALAGLTEASHGRRSPHGIWCLLLPRLPASPLVRLPPPEQGRGGRNKLLFPSLGDFGASYKHLKQIFSKYFTKVTVARGVKTHPPSASPDTGNRQSPSGLSFRAQPWTGRVPKPR